MKVQKIILNFSSGTNTLSPWESEGQVDGQRAHPQLAEPQQAPSQRAEYHCRCGTYSGGWWPLPRVLAEGTSPEKAWSHTAPPVGGRY